MTERVSHERIFFKFFVHMRTAEGTVTLTPQQDVTLFMIYAVPIAAVVRLFYENALIDDKNAFEKCMKPHDKSV